MHQSTDVHDFPSRVLNPQFNLDKLKKLQMAKFNHAKGTGQSVIISSAQTTSRNVMKQHRRYNSTQS